MTALSFADTTFAELIAIVVGAIAVSSLTYIVTRNRQMYGDVKDMKHALITPEPTSLEPSPKPGLIDVVGGLVVSVDNASALLQEHTPIVTQLRIDVDNHSQRIHKIEKHIGLE